MTRAAPRIARVATVLVLLVHLALGVTALVLLPGGFPIGELHAWTNTILPFAAVLATVSVLGARIFFPAKEGATNALLATATGGWCSAIVTGAVLFPRSMTLARLSPVVVVATLLVALLLSVQRRDALIRIAFVVGACIGSLMVLAQRAPSPSTRPLGGAPVVANPSAGDELAIECGTYTLRVAPLLTFGLRSPDRTWSLLAPTDESPPEEMRTMVTSEERPGVLTIDATTRLPHPVYSHLSSFTAIYFSFDATIAFSPTALLRTPIDAADYPTGRPMQLAYVDADNIFHVVRARDAEKGPFTELARGGLRRGEELSLEIRPTRAGERGCRLTFADWSAQVSTAPSPTAGYGLPVNSIQFFSREKTSMIALTLADTGPGRGFDSVGHVEGLYRNRIRVTPLP